MASHVCSHKIYTRHIPEDGILHSHRHVKLNSYLIYIYLPSLIYLHIVTCIPTARQRLGKHIPAQANSLNNRTSIARQRISKHTSLIIEAVFRGIRAKWL
jgi:hypothetical protein